MCGEGLEGLEFRGEALDPRVGHGPDHGQVVGLGGGDVGGGVCPADAGCPGGAQGARALSASDPKLVERQALAGMGDAGGLCGDEGLEVERVEDHRLNELRLEHGRSHAQDRLQREDQLPFVAAQDVAAKPRVAQGLQEVCLKPLLTQELKRLLVKPQPLQLLQQVVQPRKHHEPRVEGRVAKHVVKLDALLGPGGLVVSLSHGQEVEVCVQGGGHEGLLGGEGEGGSGEERRKVESITRCLG